MSQSIGNTLITMGLLFIVLGTVGIVLYKEFYARILSCSKIDTVGFSLIIIGFVVKSGFQAVSLKLLLIMVFIIVTNPVTTHVIAHAAYASGYVPRRKDQ